MSELSVEIRDDFVKRAKLNWKAKIKAFFSGGRRKYLNKLWLERADLRLNVFQRVFAQGLITADEYLELTKDKEITKYQLNRGEI